MTENQSNSEKEQTSGGTAGSIPQELPSQINARTKIVEILTRVETRQAYTDKLLEREIDNFNEADRALITEVVNGVLRWQYRLDWYLSQLYVGDYGNLIPDVKNNLRSSAYQLMYLDKVPAYAVLNEAVEVAKNKYSQKTANLVNAILRNFLRQQKKLGYVELKLDYLERLCVAHSHPHWLIQRWIEQWGIDETTALCRSNNSRPVIAVRLNRLLADEASFYRTLDENNISYEKHPDFEGFLHIHDFSEFRKLDFLKKGWVAVQDISTAIPVKLLGPHPGELVLDMCAAPGGKTALIAQQMGNQGRLVALEKHPGRAQHLHDNLQRMGVHNARIIVADSVNIPASKKFDRILLDAPCTGLGVLSKRVDLRWKRNLQDIVSLQQIQIQLLESAAEALRPGGCLVYSTCTVEIEENETVIKTFLERHPEFQADNLSKELPSRYLWENFSVRTFPHRHQMDGSFAVRLHKRPS